jgi:hypothetical protein
MKRHEEKKWNEKDGKGCFVQGVICSEVINLKTCQIQPEMSLTRRHEDGLGESSESLFICCYFLNIPIVLIKPTPSPKPAPSPLYKSPKI